MTCSHLRDSVVYGDLWADPAVRDWFSEKSRTREWLRILGWVALAQAEIGAVPLAAATRIAEVAGRAEPPLEQIAARTRESGHSTLGLVEWLQSEVGHDAAGSVALATTVQDLSDTWTVLGLVRVGGVLREGLQGIAGTLRQRASEHRTSPTLARTHGQPAVPVTLGWKLASWGVELERHLGRLNDGAQRWERCPLGGSVGTLAYWGAEAPRFLEAFARLADLPAPILPWGASRDHLGEFAGVCTLVAATLARIGNEIYQLQRPEIGEASEFQTAAQVGSVTMPHKQNPERSEHLVTLNTVVRGAASTLMAALVGEHERDGRSWKVEWVAVPDLCCYTSAAVRIASPLVDSVAFHTERMLANVTAGADRVLSEQRIRAAHDTRRYRDAYNAERSALFADTRPEQPAVSGPSLTDATASAIAFVDRWLSGAMP